MESQSYLDVLKNKVNKRKISASTLSGAIKRTTQPTIEDYKTSASILQAAVKRTKVESLYNKRKTTARKNYTTEQLKEMAKPYSIANLRKAWKIDLYKLTIYNKPINKLTKHELYHELLNSNHDFSTIPKRQKKEKEPSVQPEGEKRKRGRPAKPKVPKEVPKYLRTTQRERDLKKELGSLIKPKEIFNIDFFINKIDTSGYSNEKKIADVRDEIQYMKDYYKDRQEKRNESRTKPSVAARLDNFLKYQSERISKLESYLKTLLK